MIINMIIIEYFFTIKYSLISNYYMIIIIILNYDKNYSIIIQ